MAWGRTPRWSPPRWCAFPPKHHVISNHPPLQKCDHWVEVAGNHLELGPLSFPEVCEGSSADRLCRESFAICRKAANVCYSVSSGVCSEAQKDHVAAQAGFGAGDRVL